MNYYIHTHKQELPALKDSLLYFHIKHMHSSLKMTRTYLTSFWRSRATPLPLTSVLPETWGSDRWADRRDRLPVDSESRQWASLWTAHRLDELPPSRPRREGFHRLKWPGRTRISTLTPLLEPRIHTVGGLKGCSVLPVCAATLCSNLRVKKI